MKEKTEHHKSCLTERKKGIEILRGKYTQIWRIKMKKFAFKTKGKGRNGKRCANFWLSVITVTEGNFGEVGSWEEPQVKKVLLYLKSH